MKVYIVIELHKDGNPKILGVFKKKSDAEAIAYSGKYWCNIMETNLQ